jgi:peptide-methionine (S)-S-oxide reductase
MSTQISNKDALHTRGFYKVVKTIAIALVPALFLFMATACAQKNKVASDEKIPANTKLDTATFAGGCFWCVEAQFTELKGVVKVVSGFTGGHVANPSYEEVCTGTTGHAEAVSVIYDPSMISYDELLSGFFTAHDPTQLNRQGNDEGTQYRSAIFYHNENQKKLANYYIAKLNDSKAYNSKIVTTVSPLGAFYSAEKYHQEYYANNKEKSYCQFVIKPKLDKFRMVFKDKIKN